jgi:hypothetical protein
MKNYSFRCVALLAALFVLVFLHASATHAALYSQESSNVNYGDTQSIAAVQFLGNGLSGQVGKVCVRVSSPDQPSFKWYFGWNTQAPYYWDPAGYIFADNSAPVPQDTDIHTVCQTVNFTLNPDYYYFFVVGSSRYGSLFQVYGSDDSNAWKTSLEDARRYIDGWVDTNPLKDIWFVMESPAPSPYISVSIDIKPGSYPNSINLGSNGSVPVAIFGTATFDVTQIDLDTVTLASAPVKFKGNGKTMADYQDVNGDSVLDVVVHVATKALQLTKTDVEAELEGLLLNGQSIEGYDSVRIVP